MHYYPNQLAVGLVKQETKTIGLIIPDISNHFFANLALGIDDEMLKHDRNIILSNTNDRPERDLKSIQVLKSRGVDAIILAMASNVDQTHIRSYKDIIDNSPIPIIAVDRCNPAFNCSALKLNNKKERITLSAICSVWGTEILPVLPAPPIPTAHRNGLPVMSGLTVMRGSPCPKNMYSTVII